ncbi:perlucin-like protein isoform X2 [Nematostella vectensis]|uniref:perlucin-like protein isoform X2 n=1 Tax=Nematostella vectensis TaxID=45351 RepID=UPI002076F38A|nr:perlucin-like protein isoform X2 [Nematostella vectensis]
MACTIPMSFFTFKKLHHAMILVFAVFFISLSHTSDYSSEVCGTWKRFKQSCYIRSFQPVTRAQADEACRRLGSELVEISDNEEQEFVYRNLVDVPRPVGVWTGLIRSAETDEWSWNNRTAPTFFYWGYGEPNNYMSRGENCSEMRYWDGMWNDVLCVNKYGHLRNPSWRLLKQHRAPRNGFTRSFDLHNQGQRLNAVF